VVRNVMACPAPIDDPVRRAIRATTVALSDHLLPRTRAYHEVWLDGEKVYSGLADAQEEPIYGKTYLPRKFKIAIAYPGDNCVDVYTQDVGLVAVVEQSAEGERLRGYNVLVGGGMGMHHTKPDTFPRLGDLLGFITPEQVVNVVEQIVLIQRDYGNRVDRKQARMKYLIHNWGVSRFRTELEARVGYALQPPVPMPAMENNLHLGWHPQGDGNWFLGVSVENGRVQDTAERQLKRGLRAVVDHFRPGVRLTANHDIMLTDVAPADREQIDALLSQFGIRQSQEISLVERYAMACPAMPTCGLALAESERALPAIIDALEQEVAALGLENERITIRMTGCPNGCARPYVADIGFVGRSKDQYAVFLGGRNDGTRLNQVYADLVAGGDLVATIRPLLVYFKAARRPGERFGDFCSRIGMLTLAKIAHAQYQQRSENDDHARIAA
jgi:sulfite reductase (ferredoxin)